MLNHARIIVLHAVKNATRVACLTCLLDAGSWLYVTDLPEIFNQFYPRQFKLLLWKVLPGMAASFSALSCVPSLNDTYFISFWHYRSHIQVWGARAGCSISTWTSPQFKVRPGHKTGIILPYLHDMLLLIVYHMILLSFSHAVNPWKWINATL